MRQVERPVVRSAMRAGWVAPLQRTVRRAATATVRRRWSGGLALSALLALGILTGCAAPPASSSGPPSPTATPTAEQRVAMLARDAAGSAAQSVAVAYDQHGALTLTATVGGPVPGTPAEIAASQERVKAICFRIERALWTSGTPLSEVKVVVVGPIYDDYADLTTGPYGATDLKAAAAKLDWAQLNPDTAWALYQVWLRPAYRSSVLGL